MVKKQKLQKENRGNTNVHIKFHMKKFIARPSKYNEQHNLIDRFFFCFSSIMQIGPGESTLKRNFQQIQEREGRHTPNPLYQAPAPPRGAQPNQQARQQQQKHAQQRHGTRVIFLEVSY